MNDTIAQLIVWLPFLGFLFCTFSGMFIKNRDLQKRAVSIVAPAVILTAFIATLFIVITKSDAPRQIIPLIPGTSVYEPWLGKYVGLRVNFNLLIDPLSLFMCMIITGVGGLIHVYAAGYMAEDKEVPRFFTYFNLFILMMLLLVMGDNLLLMFVGWEGVGTCSYLLIAFWYADDLNARAGNKAFIMNRVGDLGFALGMMVAWSYFGTLTFFAPDGRGIMDLANHHHVLSVIGSTVPTYAITAICLLLFVGAVGKSAQIPLFTWLPDAMAGPTPVSALIHAATMVTAGIVMLARCSWLYVHSPFSLEVVSWIGAITAFVAASIAFVQTDIKKVLAYSTISQLGYMVLACGVGDFTDGLFHVITHAFFKALLFLGAGAVIHSMLGEQDMRKMGGLKKYLPATWLLMIIGTYAIAGFPLLSGFWSKDAILDSASRSFAGNGVILYVIGIVTAFMTAFYMNRLMWKTFYTNPRFENGHLAHQHHSNDEHTETHEESHGSVVNSPSNMMVPCYILAVLAIGFGWFAGPYGPDGGNLLQHFLSPSIAPISLGNLQEAPPLFSPMIGYTISSIVAIAGLALAAMMYRSKMETGAILSPEQRRSNLLVRFLEASWGFDTLYNLVFVRGGSIIANRVLKQGVEEDILNGTTDGVVRALNGFSRILRKMQTGYVRNYALVMLFGMVAIVISLLIKIYL